MGLIRAAFASAGGVLKDQWKEYFHCDSMTNEQLVVKGYKQTKGNNKGNTDIISNGSVVAVNEGQAALIVEDGKIVEFCGEAGRFVWDSSTEPSVFTGGFFKGIGASFKQFGKRFTFGGDTGKVQRVYYVNTKEIMNNKFGTSTPMPYDDPYYRTVLYIRYFGQYSFKITDPIVFYASLAGNIGDVYTADNFRSMATDEFMTALDTSLSLCANDGIKFSQLPQKQREIAKFMSDTLDEEWRAGRGIEIASVALAKVTPDDKSRERIEAFDTNVMHSDPNAMAGGLAYAQMEAMKNASKNSAGAMTGFMGFGMAQGAMNSAQGSQATLIDTAHKLDEDKKAAAAAAEEEKISKAAAEADANTWKCPACGNENTGKFCSECGEKKPEAPKGWVCPECGKENTGKFCSECGAKRPLDEYTCKCGYKSDKPFKFCPECGEKGNF